MRTDEMIKQDVLEELIWEPSINETQIGVAVSDGIVTLSGNIGLYAEKIAAENAAKRVSGVRAVVDDIDVRIGTGYKRTDQDIARAALDNLRWNSMVPEDQIKLKVEDGWITLEGTVEWNYQKESARTATVNLTGVKGVTNKIEVRSAVEPKQVKEKIKNALQRYAAIDAENINVTTEGHKVILSGAIPSWTEKRQVENAAWSAPGVTQVVNNLEISEREHAL